MSIVCFVPIQLLERLGFSGLGFRVWVGVAFLRSHALTQASETRPDESAAKVNSADMTVYQFILSSGRMVLRPRGCQTFLRRVLWL